MPFSHRDPTKVVRHGRPRGRGGRSGTAARRAPGTVALRSLALAGCVLGLLGAAGCGPAMAGPSEWSFHVGQQDLPSVLDGSSERLRGLANEICDAIRSHGGNCPLRRVTPGGVAIRSTEMVAADGTSVYFFNLVIVDCSDPMWQWQCRGNPAATYSATSAYVVRCTSDRWVRNSGRSLWVRQSDELSLTFLELCERRTAPSPNP